MKLRNALFLLSSAAPLVAVFGFAPLSSPQQLARGVGLHRAPSGQPFLGYPRYLFSSGNPLDIVSSFFSQSPSLTDKAMSVNVALSSTLSAVPDWNKVRSHLESQMTSEDERNFRSNLVKGYGVGSPLHKLRLFDESNKEQDVRVIFYRDSASWCPYCQKVWLALEEKRIPYRVEKINMRCYGEKPDFFNKLQPSGQIPVATIDGTTLRQSNDILFALDDLFPKHKRLSAPDSLKGKAQEYLRLERQVFSAWMYWLTGGGAQAKRNFVETLAEVEKALQQVSDGPFFLGKDITIVDVQFAPFLERMAASLLYYKGFQIRVVKGDKTEYPAINAWFDAMEMLPSYQLTKSDYYTHCWDLPPQLGGCVSEAGGKVYEDAINGLRSLDGRVQGSWDLPLQPHNGGVEPDWEWAGDGYAARREAVERLSGNYAAIVKFAARGAGTKGFPRYGAPLSDPNAIPNEDVLPAVDHVLRIVCMALLDGVDTQEKALEETVAVLLKDGGKEFVSAVIASLSYMRDRVGVPRDMKLPAARQLRAHF